MVQEARHDAWQAADSYDRYMGRWSRQVASLFLDWLDVDEGVDWLEVGCGTGALSAAILAQRNPRSLIAVDQSQAFVSAATAGVDDPRAVFQVGDAQSLDLATASRDAIVSALVLNFVPDKVRALAEMKRVARRGATIGIYVWDYPGDGLGFVRAFWDAAAALDPRASEFAENRRFSFCTPEGMSELFVSAGLAAPVCRAIEIPTVFQNFDDFWRPFTLGAGPAPGYCASLSEDRLRQLSERLRETLPRNDGGAIPLKARAWALRTTID
ncbi:MAG: class I SAM-dependent methyltransferase [Bauldia sp.]|nr:class I SAM-dependent methyltransferase [Bauldia sp.]